MIDYDKFARLKQLSDDLGRIYGTEDFALYLYSLVKMSKPGTILELGTGLGISSLWMSLALKENNHGVLHTVDNGSVWGELVSIKDRLGNLFNVRYEQYIENIIKEFGVESTFKFYLKDINKVDANNIDILFSDYAHDAYSVLNLLAKYLMRMNDGGYIFIDSASTYYPSYSILSALIDSLNKHNIPSTFIELVESGERERLVQRLKHIKLELIHLVESKNRSQNSTAQIRILPKDLMPFPRINIRF